MFCTKCGAQVPDGTKYCAVCGGKIEAITPQANENVNVGVQQPNLVAESEKGKAKKGKGKLGITLAIILEVIAIIAIWAVILFPKVKGSIDTSAVSKKLVGTWKLVDGSYKVLTHSQECYDIEYTFNSDGTGEYFEERIQGKKKEYEFEWKVEADGKYIVLTIDGDSKYDKYLKIELDGNELMAHEVGYFDTGTGGMVPEYKLKKN